MEIEILKEADGEPAEPAAKFAYKVQMAMVSAFEAGVPVNEVGDALATAIAVLMTHLKPDHRIEAMMDVARTIAEAVQVLEEAMRLRDAPIEGEPN